MSIFLDVIVCLALWSVAKSTYMSHSPMFTLCNYGNVPETDYGDVTFYVTGNPEYYDVGGIYEG